MLCICAGKGSNSKTRRGQKQKDIAPFPLAEPLQSAPAAAARQRKEAVTLLCLFACVHREAPSLSLLGTHLFHLRYFCERSMVCFKIVNPKVYQSVTLNSKIHQSNKIPWAASYAFAPSVKPVVLQVLALLTESKIFDFNTSCLVFNDDVTTLHSWENSLFHIQPCTIGEPCIQNLLSWTTSPWAPECTPPAASRQLEPSEDHKVE